MQFVLFSLDDGRYALRLSAIDRITRIVEITRLPKAPDMVLGLANLAGKIIPVLDIRRRFRLPDRALDLGDRLMIARTSRRIVGIVADAVLGIVQRSEEEVVAANQILCDLSYIDGVLKFEDGLVLIHDLDKFLSLREENLLDEALRSAM
jgi:purine-binding chemotaxis protein CheW